MALLNSRALVLNRPSTERPRPVLGSLRQRLARMLRVPDGAYVAELEQELAALDRELAELRTRTESADEVANELKRVGEQTSTVLIAAHQQREEILRAARAEAERCLAEARASASAVTARCEARLRELEDQNAAARGERDRLVEQLRAISAGLAAVADSVDA